MDVDDEEEEDDGRMEHNFFPTSIIMLDLYSQLAS